MNKSTLIFLLLCLFGIVLPSCTSDKRPLIETECPDIAPVWDEEVVSIIEFSCAYVGCHVGGNGIPGNYTTYSGISTALTRGDFETRTLEIKDMPPSNSSGPTSLTEEELITLTCWAEAGYPQN